MSEQEIIHNTIKDKIKNTRYLIDKTICNIHIIYDTLNKGK